MTELEKFKRRMIRMVARLHVQEKKPEDELWEYLRKQTKCDCKWLWERMRALTLKRLKRLLIAEDRQENIAAIARMSLTDWLLFDCILVHEKIDVIGTELMIEGRKSEPRPLYELFSMVQVYDLEGQSGENLARAWTAATVNYNSRGRQCSPMLLQRRWYQLKEATRQKFYNFWFMYRGNVKLLEVALKDKPTKLQAAIAKRYPHIITTQFLPWEELIEKRLVIMPAEFEIQMKTRSGQLPAPIDDNDADLVLLEPEIETIDLGVDTESDDDLRDEVEGSKAKQMIADEDIAAVNSIILKEEPMDEDPVESVDLDQTNLDIDMEGIEALENIDIPIEDNITNNDSLNNKDAMDSIEDETRESTETETGDSEEKEFSATTTVDVYSSPIRDEPQSSRECESTLEEPVNISLTTSSLTSESIEDVNILHTEKPTSPFEEILPVEEITPKIEPTETSELKTYDSEVNTETAAMPQISNVFGNVNIPDESIHELSSYLEKTKTGNIATEENIDDEIEDDIIKTEIDVSYEAENVERYETYEDQVTVSNVVDDNDESNTKTAEEKTIDNSLVEVIPEMTFEDDGIEFIDDGIIEEQDGVHIEEETSKLAKQEISSEDDRNSRESQSIDLKLLMVPVVYTKKLEHMNILKDKPVSHVNDKDSIELILNESKPVSEKSIQIKEEQPDTNVVSDDEEAAHDDLFDRPESANNSVSDSDDESLDGISEAKKVDKSSILFQKPRNRDYGPLVVCKNPDFNTRLKRLTVGFLSYTRNRFLLRACKPLTIDLCKAFESKLVDNTIYFKEASTSEIVVKEETPDANDNESQTPPVAVAKQPESLIQATVIPSSSSVQSLMDTMVKQQFLSPPPKESTKDVTKPENEEAITERNKVIVLPNIDNVRRINRQLLVAEVSPMRVVENLGYTNIPPVSLVSQSNDKLKPSIDKEQSIDKTHEKEISGGTVICSGEVIAGVTNNYVSHKVRESFRKNKTKPLPWRTTHRESVGFWTSTNYKKPNRQTYSEDQLLTVDTLNKMLSIILLKDPINEINPFEKTTNNKKEKSKQAGELQKKVNEIQKKLTGEHSRNTMETKRKKIRKRANQKIAEAINQMGYGTYCCWVKFKEIYPTTCNPHPCGTQCNCCCGKKQIDAETDPSILKVCESIESVVEQSREIVNENVEKDQLEDEVGKNIVENSAIEKNTPNIDANECTNTNSDTDTMSVNTIVKSSVIEKNITENVSLIDDTVPDYSNETVVSQDQTTRRNDCVVIDSDETETQNVMSPPVKITVYTGLENGEIAKRKRGRPRKNSFSTNSTNVTATVLSQQPITSAGDSVVIDFDEPGTQSFTHPPPFKITVHRSDAQDNVEMIKRKRGRPPKSIVPQSSNFFPIRTLRQIAPRSFIRTRLQSKNAITEKADTITEKADTITERPNAISERPTSSRFNLFPIEKKQNTEIDKYILFSKSSRVSKKPNNPIFLGKNKILLTDVPLPRNKDKPVEEVQSPALINSANPLPRGVNLVLLPNGVLTCTVEPNIQLTLEEITNLSAIIEDIQKRLSSVSNTPMQPVPNMQLGPTLQLAPGMVPTVVQSTSEVINLVDGENNEEENSNNNKQDIVSTMSLDSENAENVNIIEENTNLITQENTVPVSGGVHLALDVSTIANSSIDQPSSESTVTTETVQNTAADQEIDSNATKETSIGENTVYFSNGVDPTLDVSTIANSTTGQAFSEQTVTPETVQNTAACNNNQEIDSDAAKDTVSVETNNETTEKYSDATKETVSVETYDENTEETSEKEKSSEPDTSNKKTILSDLMEMSGIFDEDIAPVTETTPALQIAEAYPGNPEVSEVVIPPPLHILDSNQSQTQSVTNSLPELSPVTSFSELKYACLHNGNFFKLDLETNALTPINVCIKKKAPQETPTQFVDLTEDADDTENEANAKEIVKGTDEDSLPTFVVRKTVTPALTLPKQSLIKKGATAKPMKLFKVVHPFANSNKSYSIFYKKDEVPKEDIVSDKVTSKTVKRVRKQNFEKLTYEMQYVNFIASDDEQENYEFEGSFEEPVASVDDSDSSDDEPLAKKVKRREETQKEVQEETVDIDTETPSTSDGNEPTITEPSTAEPENATENSELPLPMEVVEEREVGSAELEFISDQNEEEDEDCILGF